MGHFKVTSPQDIRYNCMAWAMKNDSKWWEPSDAGYWPTDEQEFSIKVYHDVFESLGFSKCDSGDPEDDVEKIAVYLHADEVTHVARQLESGKWTSKLGSDVDIEHDLEGLEGDILGEGYLFLPSLSMSPKKASFNY